MAEELKIEIDSGRLDGERVVGQLVSFLKASFIYPANNRRVLDSANDLIDSVEREATAVSGLTVHVVGDEVQVDGEGVELPEALNTWLRESFYRAGLAGVELRAGLRRETLAEFAERLRHATRDRTEDFTNDWPEDLVDLVPLDMMFRGFHRAGAKARGIDEDSAESLFGGGPLLTEPLAPDSAQSRLAERISANEEISARLAAIRERWREAIDEDTEAARVDLVSEIARLLPAEAMRNEERAIELLHGVLDVLETYVPGEKEQGGSSRSVAADSYDLHGMALSVARRFFDVQIPTSDQDREREDPLPAERPGDKIVKDDLDALIAEYERLPEATGISFPTDDETLSGELVGVYLHRLVAEPDGEQTPRLKALLAELLDDLTDARVDVLRSYLEPCLTGDVDAARGSPEWQILAMLREQGRLTVLRQAGLLNAELAATLFPDLFDIFLDSLSPDAEEDREQLSRTVALIGVDRIREATVDLASEKKLLTPGRIRMVLAVDSPEIVPLVGVFAENSDVATRRDIALLLKKLEPPAPESAALRAVNPSDLLPAGYLRDLCQFDWKLSSEKLRRYSRFLLQKYITDTAGDSSLVEKRIYAIRALAHLPGEETEALLRELSKRGRLLMVTKAAKAIRQAATRTLEEIENV